MSNEENATDGGITKDDEENLRWTRNADEHRTSANHLPRPTAWLVQLVGQHLKEGDVQEGSTGDTLNMLLCLGKKSRSLLRQQKGQSVSTWSIFDCWIHVSSSS